MNDNCAVRPMDVLFGRGAKANNNPGNKVYRRLIKHKGALFEEFDQVKRKRLAKSIVMAINSQGSRFMKINKVTGKWVKAKDREARAKTMESLRKFKSISTLSNETEDVEEKISYCEGFQDDCAWASSPANSCARKSASVPACLIHAAQPLKSTWLPVDTDMHFAVKLVGQSQVMKSPAQKKENAKCSKTKVENARCLKTKVGGSLYPFRSNEPETLLPHQVFFTTSESCFPSHSQPTLSPHQSRDSSTQPSDHSLLNFLSADLSQRSRTETFGFSNDLGTLWPPVPHEKEQSTICSKSAEHSLEPLRIFLDEGNETPTQLHPLSLTGNQRQQTTGAAFCSRTRTLDEQRGFGRSEEMPATAGSHLLSADLFHCSRMETFASSNDLGASWLPVPPETEQTLICNESAGHSPEPLPAFCAQLHPLSSAWPQKKEVESAFPSRTRVLDVPRGFEGSEEMPVASRSQGRITGACLTQDVHGAANSMHTFDVNENLVGIVSGSNWIQRYGVYHPPAGTENELLEGDWISRFDLDEQTEDLIVV